MGNSNSAPNNTLNSYQQNALSKLETILGGSDTETFVTNQNNEHLLNRFNNLMMDSEVNNKYNAVSGDTETLNNFIQPEPTLNHAVFETTSDALPFTISENLVPVVKPAHLMHGGNNMDTLNKLSNLLQDTETNFTGSASNANIVNRLSSLLESTETNDYALNFRGGGLDSENLFTSEDVKGGKHEKSEESKKHGKHGKHEKEESEEKKEEESEEEKNKTEESAQSGGEKLDSELQNILMTLKKENAGKNKSVISGGKTKKGGKKGKKSKSSRRTATSAVESDDSEDETSAANTEDSESDSDSDEYLSTSSLNTSDINVKHYR
jgi:hypothetical protein